MAEVNRWAGRKLLSGLVYCLKNGLESILVLFAAVGFFAFGAGNRNPVDKLCLADPAMADDTVREL